MDPSRILTSNADVHDYLQQFLDLADEIEQCGSRPPDDHLKWLIANGLPDDYRPIIKSLQQRDETEKTSLTEYCCRLVLEAEELKSRELTSGKFMELGAYVRGQRRERKNPNPIFRGRCYRCDQPGHRVAECTWSAKDAPRQSETAARVNVINHGTPMASSDQVKQKGKERPTEHAMVTASEGFSNKVPDDDLERTTTFETCFVAQTGDMWLVDSGATSHMTFQKADFSSLDTAFRTTVRVADDRALVAYGRGTVVLTVLDVRGSEQQFVMANVLWVPDLSFRLFSVRRVSMSGHRVVFGGAKRSEIECAKGARVPLFEHEASFWLRCVANEQARYTSSRDHEGVQSRQA
eukprot:c12635_g1_i2.p1 GENE.c12635_g1_i2~~c12635_g1_i2.p1  ORF type:complete len:350 (+),score=38.80 c12635_g1_i2:149-1198(+)